MLLQFLQEEEEDGSIGSNKVGMVSFGFGNTDTLFNVFCINSMSFCTKAKRRIDRKKREKERDGNQSGQKMVRRDRTSEVEIYRERERERRSPLILFNIYN